MSIADRKQRQKEKLKSNILNAAKDVLMEKGIENISLRNIAERIHYSPTTIYLYFKNKDDILRAIYQDGFITLNQYMSGVAQVSDPLERLKVICNDYVSFAADHPKLYDLMFLMQSPLMASQKEGTNWEDSHRLFSMLNSNVTECRVKGRLKSIDSERLSLMLLSMLHGACSLAVRNRTVVIEDSLNDEMSIQMISSFFELLETP